jgi:PKD repeat protein
MKVPLYYFKENGEKSVFVDFKINQDSIFEGDTVFFSNLSCGCPFPYSYSWEFEAGIPDISTDIHPAIVYPNAGVYDVSLMADNGVNIVTEYKPDYITVYPYADVNAVLDQTNITISPNPGSGLFKIILPQTNPGHPEIAVFDVIGKVIEPANIIIKRSSISLDVTNQENGIYFVKINQGNKNYLSKIAVQK